MLTINRVVLPSPEQWDIVIEGMRNPKNSWDKSDSGEYWEDGERHYTFGRNDLALMEQLSKAGKDHRKFMRMLPVWVTVNAPLYFWKEMDTHSVGKTQNSCSTMHTIHKKPFTLDDFSHERMVQESEDMLLLTIAELNYYRGKFLETKDKRYWYSMIQLLPSSYNQKRTLFLNYEVLANIYRSRRYHKLDEWHTFCDFIQTLPNSHLITGDDSHE